MATITCRFDMYDAANLLYNGSSGPTFRRHPKRDETFRTIGTLQLPEAPAVGETFNLDGHPYTVHERGWATRKNDNPQLYCSIKLIDKYPEHNPIRKEHGTAPFDKVENPCCEIDTEGRSVETKADVKRMFDEPVDKEKLARVTELYDALYGQHGNTFILDSISPEEGESAELYSENIFLVDQPDSCDEKVEDSKFFDDLQTTEKMDFYDSKTRKFVKKPEHNPIRDFIHERLAEIESLKKARNTLQRSNKNLRDGLETMQVNWEECKKQYAKCSDDRNKMAENILSLENANVNFSTRLAKVNTSLAEKTELFEQKCARVKELSIQLADAKVKWAEFEELSNKLAGELKEERDDKAYLKKRLDAHVGHLTDARKEIREVREELSEIKTVSYDSLTKQIQQLEQDLHSAKVSYQSMRTNITHDNIFLNALRDLKSHAGDKNHLLDTIVKELWTDTAVLLWDIRDACDRKKASLNHVEHAYKDAKYTKDPNVIPLGAATKITKEGNEYLIGGNKLDKNFTQIYYLYTRDSEDMKQGAPAAKLRAEPCVGVFESEENFIEYLRNHQGPATVYLGLFNGFKGSARDLATARHVFEVCYK